MIIGDVITEARRLLNDTLSPLRYSNTVLLGFANTTLKRIATLRPDLFALEASIPSTPGTVLQSLPSDSVALLDVFGVTGGNAVTEVSKATMDQHYPGWRQEPTGAAINWMRNKKSRNTFFIYPRPPSGQFLDVQYAQQPPDYGLTTTIALLPDAYFPTMVDGVMFMAQSIDDEHIATGRAQLFAQAFAQSLAVAEESKAITDAQGDNFGAESRQPMARS